MDLPDSAPLFAWAALEDCPSLQTIDLLLRTVPDRELLAALRAHRANGRDDYPVEACWGVVLLTTILRHATTEACLTELRRNPSLRLRLGILREADVPKACTRSRFFKVLGQPPFLALLKAANNELLSALARAVPDLGRRAAGDSTALRARRDRSEVGTPPDLPAPSGGRKEYRDADGKVTDVLEWYGYKLHLVVDTQHEVALGYRVTAANGDDALTLPPLLDEVQAVLPPGRMATLAYDKAADTNAFHQAVVDRGVKPVVEIRSLWQGEPDRELPGTSKRPVRLVYDEAGTVHCGALQDGETVWRAMAYRGHERARGTLKYQCPALAYGFACSCEHRCNRGKIRGLTVRVKCDIDLRRFPAIPRATKQFERLYKGRTAVERVNARLKVFWGADDGNIGGAARFHAQIGVVMLVHTAFATVLAATPRRHGVLGVTRLGPVQEALRQAIRPPRPPAR